MRRSSRTWPFLSPIDVEWTWQDSLYVTAERELLIEFTNDAIKREEPGYYPLYVDRARRNAEVVYVLRVLDATRSLQRVLEREVRHLVAELRARGTSWEVIGLAMGVTRQTVYEKFRDRVDDFRVYDFLTYELDAARRVALEIVSSNDEDDEKREEAHDFLDWSDQTSSVKKTAELKRLYR